MLYRRGRKNSQSFRNGKILQELLLRLGDSKLCPPSLKFSYLTIFTVDNWLGSPFEDISPLENDDWCKIMPILRLV